MANQIDDILTFGKYKGMTVENIYKGSFWSVEAKKNFVRNYIEKKLQDAKVLSYFINEDTIEVYDSINYILLSSFLNGLEKRYRSFDYSSINEHLLNGTYFPNHDRKIFADPGYIFWCVSKFDELFITEDCKTKLSEVECIFFKGVEINTTTKAFSFDYNPTFEIVNIDFQLVYTEYNQLN